MAEKRLESKNVRAKLAEVTPHEITNFVRGVAAGKSKYRAFKEAIVCAEELIAEGHTQSFLLQKFLQNRDVAQSLEIAKSKAVSKSSIDAAWVLKQAEMLFNKCIADDDNVTAKHTLEMIGKHKFVDAFASKKIDMTTQGKPMNISFDITFADPTPEQIAAADLSKGHTIEHEPEPEQTLAVDHKESNILDVEDIIEFEEHSNLVTQ